MKPSLNFMVAACMAMILFACDDGYITEGLPTDQSVAASICFIGYRVEATGSYDDKPLKGYLYNDSHFDIQKVSDKEVKFFGLLKWDGTDLLFSIPSVPISGERFDVGIETICSDAEFGLNGTIYNAVPTRVKGWIKAVHAETASSATRYSPATPDYRCGIEIECDVDGKKFALEITSAKPQAVPVGAIPSVCVE